jgi:hypothetical protein
MSHIRYKITQTKYISVSGTSEHYTKLRYAIITLEIHTVVMSVLSLTGSNTISLCCRYNSTKANGFKGWGQTAASCKT